MADTGWVICGTGYDTNIVPKRVFNNPTNIQVDDTSYATSDADASGSTEYIGAYNWGLSVPAGATIDGIEVRINAKRSGVAGSFANMKIGYYAYTGTTKNPGTSLTLSDADYDFGAADDLWGHTGANELNADAVNHNSQFYFQANFTRDFYEIISIDYIKIKVHYTPAAGAKLPENLNRLQAIKRLGNY